MKTKPKFESRLHDISAHSGLTKYNLWSAINAYKGRGENIYWRMRAAFLNGSLTKLQIKEVYASTIANLRAENVNNEWEIRAAMHSRKLFNQWIKTQ